MYLDYCCRRLQQTIHYKEYVYPEYTELRYLGCCIETLQTDRATTCGNQNAGKKDAQLITLTSCTIVERRDRREEGGVENGSPASMVSAFWGFRVQFPTEAGTLRDFLARILPPSACIAFLLTTPSRGSCQPTTVCRAQSAQLECLSLR